MAIIVSGPTLCLRLQNNEPHESYLLLKRATRSEECKLKGLTL
jgi:hypothetical protein